MKKVVKRIFLIMLISIAVFNFGFLICYAAEYSFDYEITDETETDDTYSTISQELIGDDIEKSLPDEAKSIIDDLDIKADNIWSFENIFSAKGFETIIGIIVDYTSLPMKKAAVLLTVILIISLIYSYKDNNSASDTALSNFASLVCIGTIMLPISELISDCATVLNALSVFVMTLVPIFAGLLIAAAKSSVAVGFQAPVFLATNAVSFIATNIITPLMSIFLALSVAGGVSNEQRLFKISASLKKLTTWILTISMSIYMAIFSIKNVISSSADNAGMKTARFLFSSLVPIISTSINECLSSMSGCVAVLRNSFGIYALIALIAIVLPLVIRIIFWRIIIFFASEVADIFLVDSISEMLKSISSAIGVLLSVIIIATVMFIFSVTVLSSIGNSL